ncbi:MAG: hypothetical protein AAF490_18360 [Chloroflexota bacterium]
MKTQTSYNFVKQLASRLFLPHLLFLVVIAGCSTTEEPPVSDPTAVPEEVVTEPTNTAVPTAEPVEEPPPTLTPPPPPSTAGAGDADVLFVSARMTGENVWSFSVTVEHLDTGWEDYADGWDVVLPDGTVLLPNPDNPFTRLLLHPHENEQPFTRNQSNIMIPAEITQVTVRAHDLVDGFGGQEVVVDLTAVSGENFEVDR